NGTVDLTNLNLVDAIPAHTEFVPGSVYVGEEIFPDLNPANGISLPTIHPGDMQTVSFSVVITELPPQPYIIPNSAT
ncbi:MAG TPA: hypothetical protein DCY20_10570, partial [Firmicutes bacterium]|nr:hypothetical protein [Bacillota bacterium]